MGYWMLTLFSTLASHLLSNLPRRNWLDEKARNRELEDKLTDLAYYEVEVKTGKMKVKLSCELYLRSIFPSMRSREYLPAVCITYLTPCYGRAVSCSNSCIFKFHLQGSSTDARVYLEMFGPYDDVTTGELRLVNADSHQRCFTRDALDLFMVSDAVSIFCFSDHGQFKI
jgi:hypothetical protein